MPFKPSCGAFFTRFMPVFQLCFSHSSYRPNGLMMVCSACPVCFCFMLFPFQGISFCPSKLEPSSKAPPHATSSVKPFQVLQLEDSVTFSECCYRLFLQAVPLPAKGCVFLSTWHYCFAHIRVFIHRMKNSPGVCFIGTHQRAAFPK